MVRKLEIVGEDEVKLFHVIQDMKSLKKDDFFIFNSKKLSSKSLLYVTVRLRL